MIEPVALQLHGGSSEHQVLVKVIGTYDDGTPCIELHPAGLQHLPEDQRRLLVRMFATAIGVEGEQ